MSASQLPTAHAQTVRSRLRGSARPTPGGPSTLILARYRLIGRLGTGAFGTVWMAHDEHLDREVAVKVVAPERVLAARLDREAKAAARLSHPGIVTLYEAASDSEGAYLVSELVHGQTLGNLLSSGRLSDRDVLLIAISLCEALQYAHSRGVIHRDVKPSNVLVPDHPASAAQLAKLTDFGVARIIDGDSLTRSGDVVGTLSYMAPEQAEGREAGAPADLFALALVVYEALTGCNPLREGSAAQRSRRLGAHLPPLRRQRRELPRELGRGVDLALRPRPRERGTLAELSDAMRLSLPEVEDVPSVASGAWRTPSFRRQADESDPSWPEPPEAEPQTRPAAEDVREVGSSSEPGPAVPRRLASAMVAGAAFAWLSSQALTPGGFAPIAWAALAAIVVGVLPRLGWGVLLAALSAACWVVGHPGAGLLIAIAGTLPVLLLARDGSHWPSGAVAVGLGLLGLAGAWPAIAGRATGAWRRAALGAIGWAWLVLLAPIAGRGLYLHGLPGLEPLPAWSSSMHVTAEQVVGPLLSSGALAGALGWALAAAALPWVLRGRSLRATGIALVAWAATTVFATQAAISAAHPSGGRLPGAVAALGAILAVLIGLAPVAVRTRRRRHALS